MCNTARIASIAPAAICEESGWGYARGSLQILSRKFRPELDPQCSVYTIVYMATIATTKAAKWGNSIGVRLPLRAAARAGITEGMELSVEATEKQVTLTPAKRKKSARAPRLSLDKLIANIRPENLNRDDEWLSMKPVGKEIW